MIAAAPRRDRVAVVQHRAGGRDRGLLQPAHLGTGLVAAVVGQRAQQRPEVSRSFDRLVESSDLPRIVFHDLRRTAATLLKDLGVPARDAQMILGHSHINVTLGIYSKVFDSSLDTALMRMDHALRPQQPQPGR